MNDCIVTKVYVLQLCDYRIHILQFSTNKTGLWHRAVPSIAVNRQELCKT